MSNMYKLPDNDQCILFHSPSITAPKSRTKIDSKMSDLGPKWVRLPQNGTNPGQFQIRFQNIFAHRAKIVLKSDLKKSHLGQSDPLWASNLPSMVYFSLVLVV